MVINHSLCDHPATPAGRAACRKAGGPRVEVVQALERLLAAEDLTLKQRRRQPALKFLRQERWTIRLAAQEIGVSEWHLKNVLYGRTRPMEQVKIGLTRLVGRPVTELFTEEVRAKPHDPSKNHRRGLS
ncbi:hypothetical protein [Micromonospora sp. NRRL B-16802]|uniref:hypothetical protein n=1 Tax=Micromonospora sp. NRRL B-16802 TaxID=1415541 RepID=UPI000ABC4938|nr:hypothetical protein [Micromonospora sp. NRRL B-16802]